MPPGVGRGMDPLPGRYMPPVEPPSWLPALLELQQANPTAHPFTLAILLEVQTGTCITGRTAAHWLRRAQAAEAE